MSSQAKVSDKMTGVGKVEEVDFSLFQEKKGKKEEIGMINIPSTPLDRAGVQVMLEKRRAWSARLVGHARRLAQLLCGH